VGKIVTDPVLFSLRRLIPFGMRIPCAGHASIIGWIQPLNGWPWKVSSARGYDQCTSAFKLLGKEVPPIVRNRNHWFTAERLAGEILSATSKPAACTTPIPFRHSPDVPSGPNSQGDTSPGFLTCNTTNNMSRLWKARINNEK
jgi:hypothetical protein